MWLCECTSVCYFEVTQRGGVFSEGSEIYCLFFALALGQYTLTIQLLSPSPALSVSVSLKYERKKIHSREGKEKKNRTGLVERGCEVKVNGAFRDWLEDVNLMITCVSQNITAD